MSVTRQRQGDVDGVVIGYLFTPMGGIVGHQNLECTVGLHGISLVEVAIHSKRLSLIHI